MSEHITEECPYCGRVVTRCDKVPSTRDEEAWADMAAEHAHYCEWILTRAHRLDGSEV